MKKYSDILKNNPLFRGLGEGDIELLLKGLRARVKSVRAEEFILRAGDTATELGFVLSGSVLIVQEDLWGRRNIMNRVPAGDTFAEAFAAASGSVLNVSVVAYEDSEILFLDLSRLLSPSAKAAPFSDIVVRNLVSVLARKTMAFNEKVTHISKRSTRERLLSYLSAQAMRRGSLAFSIEFNRQQLADYLCVERAAMCAELSKLQREGILTYHKNHFELKELAEL